MALHTADYAEKRKVMTAMSGGVDSSAAVLLLKSQGYDVGGMTMRLLEEGLNDRDIEDAAKVAEMFGVPFFVADIRREFSEKVISDFIGAYQAGATPNPCVVCNRYIKFSEFMKCLQVITQRWNTMRAPADIC